MRTVGAYGDEPPGPILVRKSGFSISQPFQPFASSTNERVFDLKM
jgi:hypothetical protein